MRFRDRQAADLVLVEPVTTRIAEVGAAYRDFRQLTDDEGPDLLQSRG
ncbi:hypothetical protein GCM10011575_01670 [Microlunatus endophyticus]|uniref:Uncharacterized protein n=1 Tax=Microlunatus endophyticus TaxID=1716077 RepID=A0A917RZK6_9ACTN|nr:hypothetical protein [Microlunatus endophyticus]GGL47483.1 hypothetical protein GCM10011575_01670 [Microlunatus endophyticus]